MCYITYNLYNHPSRPGPCILCVLRVIYRATYVNGFTMCVCCMCVVCVITSSLPPPLSLHAQVPNTLDVLSEEDFMMTQPRLVHLNGTLTVL